MTEEEIITELGSLTIKDKINVAYLIGNQILTLQKSMLVIGRESDTEVIQVIKGLVHMLPDAWKDDAFKKDYEAAKIKNKIDVRPNWCGMPASEEFCKKHGITPYIEEESIDYYKLFQASMNLLFRRGLFSEVTRVEKQLGKKWDGEGHGTE